VGGVQTFSFFVFLDMTSRRSLLAGVIVITNKEKEKKILLSPLLQKGTKVKYMRGQKLNNLSIEMNGICFN
jgi:hypothetical protein